MTGGTLFLVVASVLCNALAQIVLKLAVTGAGTQDAAPIARHLLTDWRFGIGVLLFGASFAIWMLVLARLPVSVAYPLASLGYVAAALLGMVLLNENLGLARVAGIALICGGVFLVARSA